MELLAFVFTVSYRETNYRDASAAALVAAALFELSQYVKGQKGQIYFDTAKQIVYELGRPNYRIKEGENANYVLMHSTLKKREPAGGSLFTWIRQTKNLRLGNESIILNY